MSRPKTKARKSTRHTTTDRLKEGEVLRDEILTSSDHSFELWAGTHGSLLLTECTTNKLVKDGETSRWQELSTLIPANNAKVKRVLKIRVVFKKESANGGRATVDY